MAHCPAQIVVSETLAMGKFTTVIVLVSVTAQFPCPNEYVRVKVPTVAGVNEFPETPFPLQVPGVGEPIKVTGAELRQSVSGKPASAGVGSITCKTKVPVAVQLFCITVYESEKYPVSTGV